MKPKIKRGTPRKSEGQNRHNKTAKEDRIKPIEAEPAQIFVKADTSHKLHTSNGENKNVASPAEPSDDSAKIPLHQKIFQWIGWTVLGMFFIGAGLDSISNAIALVTPTVTYGGTALVITTAIAIAVYLNFFPLSWVIEGKTTRKTRLELKQYLQVLGMILLLWIPRFFDLFKPAEPTPNIAVRVSAEQSNQSLPANQINNSNLATAPTQVQAKDYQSPIGVIKTPPKSNQSELPQVKEQTKAKQKQLDGRATLNNSRSFSPNSLAIAENLFRQGKYNDAIAACNAVLRQDPKNRNASALKQRIQKTKQILEQ